MDYLFETSDEMIERRYFVVICYDIYDNKRKGRGRDRARKAEPARQSPRKAGFAHSETPAKGYNLAAAQGLRQPKAYAFSFFGGFCCVFFHFFTFIYMYQRRRTLFL